MKRCTLLMLSCAIPTQAIDAAVTIMPLEPAWGAQSWGWAINNTGQIVGGSGATYFSMTATSWAGAAPTSLFEPNSPGYSVAYGLNDHGTVVGAQFNESNLPTPFMWHEGYFVPMEGYGTAWAVNNNGIAVGSSGALLPAMWLDGKMIMLGTLGGDYGAATGINAAGVVTGYSSTGFHNEAFRWENGVMTPLGTLGGSDSEATAINDAGFIVGVSHNAQGQLEAFIHDGSQMIGLGTHGFERSAIWNINNQNQMIGYLWNEDGPFHAIYMESGMMIMFSELVPPSTGWTYLEPHDINDHGQIVGWGMFDGQARGFVMTIPSPGSIPIVVMWQLMADRRRRRAAALPRRLRHTAHQLADSPYRT